jgi:hypothetical protein
MQEQQFKTSIILPIACRYCYCYFCSKYQSLKDRFHERIHLTPVLSPLVLPSSTNTLLVVVGGAVSDP